MIKPLMIKGIRLYSSTKKLAKINMSNTFSGLVKAKKWLEIVLKSDNYYDVQKA